jgi:hypothetical protein
MSLFSFNSILRLRLLCSYLLVTLLALLIILFLTNRGILGKKGLKTVSFAKARTLLRVT